MPDHRYHCNRAEKVFGDAYAHVHKWLDEFAFIDGKLDVNHHRHRHHREGILEVGRKWGETAEAVARQHVKDDEGKVFTKEEMSRIYPDAPEWKTLGYERRRKSNMLDKGGI